MASEKRVYPSGASKRRAKREAQQDASDDAQTAGEREEGRRLELQERADYRDAGSPPDEVVGRMAWVQGLMAKAIFWTAVHAGSTPLQSTRRTILEGGAKLGMTAVKALYEERLKKLEAKVYGRRLRKGEADASDDGLEDLPPE